MKLYIDESGNTGPAIIRSLKYNFEEQPFYVLAAILLYPEQESRLESYVSSLIKNHRIQSKELKAKNLYDSKPNFIIELIDFLNKEDYVWFIEIMDKKFYMNTQILEYCIIPVISIGLSDETIAYKNLIASNLDDYISDDILERFCLACHQYNPIEFEGFLNFMLTEIRNSDKSPLKELLVEMIGMTLQDYNEEKIDNPSEAFKKYLPIPDENNKSEHLFLLPNYHAFSNIVGRANRFINFYGLIDFEIIHDEQKHFDIIFKHIISLMKTTDTNAAFQTTIIKNKADFNLNKEVELNFEKSENSISIQVTDLLSGVIMRYFKDFELKNVSNSQKYKNNIKKLFMAIPPEGVNLVMSNQKYDSIMAFIYNK